MPFIIECIVTTMSTEGRVNFAPMGIVWALPALVIRPYTTTTTYHNLRATRQAVVHLTDDVLVFAVTALTDASWPWHPAQRVRGAILDDACAAFEVAVDDVVEQGTRAWVPCRVVHEQWMRPFLGFNRARGAVIEATILATRLPWLPATQVTQELHRLADIVDRTGGAREREALAFVAEYVRRWQAAPAGPHHG
ncbi:MAG: DUF447 family protein [Firmicutes bacterium]|nr:DUF447 family protein [Bacillota bacterium]